MKDRPLSPLVHACYKRLLRLNHETARPEWDALLQSATRQQEKKARFEMSVCGPKTIAYVLPLLGRKGVDYETIAKLCGTTDKGTSIAQLRRGLSALGIESFAYRLNREDVQNLKLPAIALVSDHFMALTKIDGNEATFYDTEFESEHIAKLPDLDDPKFDLTVIAFQRPSLSGTDKPSPSTQSLITSRNPQ